MATQLVVEQMFDPEGTRRFVAEHQVSLAAPGAGSSKGAAFK